jgi:FlaA1/EpsC-like NDP-sugar epimerase
MSTPVALGAFFTFGLYKSLVRYVTGKILLVVGKSVILAAFALVVTAMGVGVSIPRSVPLIYAVFLFLSVGGVRFIARNFFRRRNQKSKVPVLIYGVGDAGLQLLNSLFHGHDYLPVGLVDDDLRLQNFTIGGLPVSSPGDIPRLVAETGAKAVLLAVPCMGHARRREIVKSLQDSKVEIKTIPGMSEIISGKARISELRTVAAEDLLGRDTVAPDNYLLSRNISGKVVMVSGAGGSIGSELCRQILSLEPDTLILFEISEFALYASEAALSDAVNRAHTATKIIPILGSVQHSDVLEATIQRFRVQTIYHAAAYKHVPLVEENAVESIRNNVFGTLAITSAAKRLGVESFTLISTDKAVRPTNIMGATKRIAELICQAQAKDTNLTIFSMVRFGNVLGSSGSVIPRFSAQIDQGGPVTVTHRDITRFFMTIPEASQLVIQAGAMAKGGDVFVLDMGQPVKILDLAFDMIKLHGLRPYIVDHPDQVFPERGDIPVYVTGLRKGEKLYEELLIRDNAVPTQHPRIMTASEASLDCGQLLPFLNRLHAACDAFDLPAILGIIRELPVDYAPTEALISDLLWGAKQSPDHGHEMTRFQTHNQ